MFIQTSFKTIYAGCINDMVWQIIPFGGHSIREDVLFQEGICMMFLHLIPMDSRPHFSYWFKVVFFVCIHESFHDFEHFYHVTTLSPV